MNTYENFLGSKSLAVKPQGIPIIGKLNPQLFAFQSKVVPWALRKGRCALFADCGMGKTLMQLEWSKHVSSEGDVLIFAPLAVSHQTKTEGARFGYEVNICRKQEDVKPGINIANYEMLEHFDPDHFVSIVLDESSILKAMDGKTRTQLIKAFRKTPYRLACTATPAPNDFVELGNHAEFLGIMSQTEMLSTFFVHDGGDTSKWRLKGHAETEFWKWICSWAVNIRKPSDIGFSDAGFDLPPLKIHEHVIETSMANEGYLFAFEARTLSERRDARRSSMQDRIEATAALVNASDEQWVIWCDLNAESEALTKAIKGAVEVKGADSTDYKIDVFNKFVTGEVKRLVTKPLIAAWGLNWQHVCKSAWVGLSDSYEQFYQALRRMYRFGQKRQVDAHIFISNLETAVLKNIHRKDADTRRIQEEMARHMHDFMNAELFPTSRQTIAYTPKTQIQLPSFLSNNSTTVNQ